MKVLSLGLGVQSTAIYLMSQTGFLDIHIDYAIFADPKAEKPETYKYLKYLKGLQKQNNWAPIITTSKGSIIKEIKTKNRNSLPLFTTSQNKEGGMLRRQCTAEFKIIPVEQKIKELYGIKTRQRAPKTTIYLGISADEIQRLKYSHKNWIIKNYPLVGYEATKTDFKKYSDIKINRTDCKQWYKKNNFLIPPKSACFFCPYQSNQEWLKLKTESPAIFKKAVEIEKELQKIDKLNNQVFLHRDLKPIDKIDFTKSQTQINFNCGSGFCGS